MSTPTVYTSIKDVPLDEYTTPDIGDAHPITKQNLRIARKPVSQLTPKPPNPNFVIPYTRVIDLGVVGLDVVGAKRAIWRHNGLPIPKTATKNFGEVAVKQLKIAQDALDLKPDGQLGKKTLVKLAPWFDSLAFYDYAGYAPGGTQEAQIRKAIIAYCLWGYNNRAQEYYAEIRPMEGMDELFELPVEEDCSTFDTKGYKFGKALDPNYAPDSTVQYNGYGNTMSQRAHGKIISLTAAKPGDLCHYDDPQHVAVYLGSQRVCSMGSDPGPLISEYNYRPLTYIMKYTLYKGMKI